MNICTFFIHSAVVPVGLNVTGQFRQMTGLNVKCFSKCKLMVHYHVCCQYTVIDHSQPLHLTHYSFSPSVLWFVALGTLACPSGLGFELATLCYKPAFLTIRSQMSCDSEMIDSRGNEFYNQHTIPLVLYIQIRHLQVRGT